MDSGLTASDVALMSNNEWGGNSFLWIFALLILANGGFGGWGNNRNNDFGTYATAASQNEILLGQKFDAMQSSINKVGDGLASLGYSQLQQMSNDTASINGNITSEGRALQTQLSDCCCTTQRNIDSVRFDMANYTAQTNANTTAQVQKVLDAIAQNKIETLQGQVNQLQLQNAMCGVVRYPNAWTYNAGTSPFCGCNCNGSAI